MKMFTSRRGISLAALAGVLAGAAVAAAQPAVRVEPTSLDFGKMKQHETRSAEVVIANDGNELLEIQEVETTCGCTAAEPTASFLRPGESTTLRIDFNSKTFQGDQHKKVVIHTNDPRQPESYVDVLSRVIVPLMTTPPLPRLGFGKVRQGDTPTETYRFEATTVDDLDIELVRNDPDITSIEVVDNYEGDPRRAALRVTLAPNVPMGKQRDVIRVATNVPETPTMDIDVMVNVIQDLTVMPERVNLRFVTPGEEVHGYVRVSGASNDVEFRVTGAEVDIPGLAVQIDETVPNREFFIRIGGQALPADNELVQNTQGRLKGTLRIETSALKQPVIEVPVSYMIRL